jgi:hypothetical protein
MMTRLPTVALSNDFSRHFRKHEDVFLRFLFALAFYKYAIILPCNFMIVRCIVDAAAEGSGWLRQGYDISYYANNYARGNNAQQCGEGVACYYTLTFSIEFKHAKDTVLIAYSYPYTLTDYKLYLKETLARPYIGDILRVSRYVDMMTGLCI